MRKINIILVLISAVILICSFAFIKFRTENAEASELNSYDALIRVGISSNDFSSLEYKEISFKGGLTVVDKSLNSVIATTNSSDVIKFTVKEGNFTLYVNNSPVPVNISSPVGIKSNSNIPIEITGLKRAGKQAAFRGEFELVKHPSKPDKFYVVNILSLEDYLKGVVPNELPVSFGLEALKAQAIAARNYAIKPRLKAYSQFDVCDSVECQVYFGYNTEKELSGKAVDETKNLIALYNGDIILALYSSTAGGYTESYENAFSDPSNMTFPANPLPYLTGKPDNQGTPPLNNEEDARNFYMNSYPAYDINSSYYRWSKTWTREELEQTLSKTLVKWAHTQFVTPILPIGSDIGTIKNIEVLLRGVSGKAMVVKISTDKGEWFVKKELFIRRIFQNEGKMLPSANVVFDLNFDPEGNLIKITATGGGLGHGVGMSQYGAGFMSKNGSSFADIIQHYYDKTAIGTPPVSLKQDSQPVKQLFFSPNGKGEIVIKNQNNASSVKILLNSKEIQIPSSYFTKDILRLDTDSYIYRGVNEIIYYTPMGGKGIKAWVEVYRAKDESK